MLDLARYGVAGMGAGAVEHCAGCSKTRPHFEIDIDKDL